MNELGLFPLGIVLLPTEQIPLHIFEERYQELIGECLDSSGEFWLLLAASRARACSRSAAVSARSPSSC